MAVVTTTLCWSVKFVCQTHLCQFTRSLNDGLDMYDCSFHLGFLSRQINIHVSTAAVRLSLVRIINTLLQGAIMVMNNENRLKKSNLILFLIIIIIVFYNDDNLCLFVQIFVYMFWLIVKDSVTASCLFFVKDHEEYKYSIFIHINFICLWLCKQGRFAGV